MNFFDPRALWAGKDPSLGTRGLVDRQCICPFRPTDSLGRKGQIHCVSARPLVPREGLYQIHGQSLNTHRGKHRSGGAPTKGVMQPLSYLLREFLEEFSNSF